jgi:hypothetical protein
VQVGGTAANTQYRADITLPAGKAVDYRMDITFMEADQFYLVDLQSQLATSGWPYHVQALVTAPPAAPAHLTFHRGAAGRDEHDRGELGRPGRRPAGAHGLDGDRQRLRHAAELQRRRRALHRGAEVRHHVHGHREPAQQRWQLAVDDRIRPGLSRALRGSPLLR